MEVKLNFRMAHVEPYYPEVDGKRQVLTWQRKFHYGITPSRKGADFTLISGGLGCGMTTAICADIALHMNKFPGIHLAVIAPFEYVFKEFFSPVLAQAMDRGGLHFPKERRTASFLNNSILTLKSSTNPNELRGFQCHRGYMIEAAVWTDTKGKGMVEGLNQQCRAHGDFPRGVVVQQNPKGHNWAYDVFVKPAGEENFIDADGCRQWEHTDSVTGDTYYTLGIPSSANKFLNGGYVKSMLRDLENNPELKARMIDGEFNAPNGL